MTTHELSHGLQAINAPRYDYSYQQFCIDSRQISAGCVFFALQGERVDGHQFCASVIEQGALAVVVSQQRMKDVSFSTQITALAEKNGVELFYVDDTTKSLASLASYYRQSLEKTKIVGITGSFGKTTTKEILGTLLRAKFATFVSPGNLNSYIGLPLATLQIPPESEVAILELGIDFVGEMDLLVDIAQPDVIILTSVGLSHAEQFGDIFTIASEKIKIFNQNKKNATLYFPQQTLTYNNEKRELASFIDANKKDCRCHEIAWQSIENVCSHGLQGTSFLFEKQEFHLPLLGEALVLNTVLALSCARDLGVSIALLQQALSDVKSVAGRAHFLAGKPSWIDDSYNASLQSVLSGIDFISSLAYEGRRILILADMKELGTYTETAHLEVAKKLIESNFDALYLYGTEMLAVQSVVAAQKKVDVRHFDTIDDVIETVENTFLDTDLYYVKGAFSTQIYKVINHFHK